MTEKQNADLTRAQDEFIAAWGQMAGAWGISRTMAEVHALLYITGAPLTADEVIQRLAISRGNASMSLRALLDWGIVQRTHRRGERKEYFEAEQDVWTLFRAIVRERLAREVEPLLAAMYEIRDLTGGPRPADAAARQRVEKHNRRLDELLAFCRTLDSLGRRFVSPAGKGLQVAATLLAGRDDAERRRGPS